MSSRDALGRCALIGSLGIGVLVAPAPGESQASIESSGRLPALRLTAQAREQGLHREQLPSNEHHCTSVKLLGEEIDFLTTNDSGRGASLPSSLSPDDFWAYSEARRAFHADWVARIDYLRRRGIPLAGTQALGTVVHGPPVWTLDLGQPSPNTVVCDDLRPLRIEAFSTSSGRATNRSVGEDRPPLSYVVNVRRTDAEAYVWSPELGMLPLLAANAPLARAVERGDLPSAPVTDDAWLAWKEVLSRTLIRCLDGQGQLVADLLPAFQWAESERSLETQLFRLRQDLGLRGESTAVTLSEQGQLAASGSSEIVLRALTEGSRILPRVSVRASASDEPAPSTRLVRLFVTDHRGEHVSSSHALLDTSITLDREIALDPLPRGDYCLTAEVFDAASGRHLTRKVFVLPADGEDGLLLLLNLSWERVGGSLMAEASAVGAGVAKIGFRLTDSTDVTWDDTAPFRATIPVRADRYAWEVEAQAIGVDGTMVATEAAVLSVLPKSPSLLLSHLPTQRPGARRLLVELALSHGQTIKRIEIFRDGVPVAALEAPPYIVELPAQATGGSVLFARASLSTGEIIEDALLLDEGREHAERVRIVTLEVPFRVEGRAVDRGLDAGALRITLDEERILPTQLLFLESLPLQVQLALDSSATMHEERGLLTTLLKAFTEEVIKPTDRVGVISFDHRIVQTRPLSTPSGALAVDAPPTIGGGTAIMDAIVAAVAGMSDAPGRRAVIVVSDGLDEHSATSGEYVEELLARARVGLYFLHLNRRSANDMGVDDGFSPEQVLRHLGQLRAFWREQALKSGGRYCFAGSTEKARGCLEEFEAHLRTTYVAVAQLSEAQRVVYERGATVGLEAVDGRARLRIRDR